MNYTTVCSILSVLLISTPVFSQENDSLKKRVNFNGSASITNNGFSFVPSFSLGKPAAIFNFNINGGKRFSFEPEFRFSLLDAKPWSFIFIWRYKLINKPRLQLTVGGHLPAIPFRTIEYVRDGLTYKTLATYRFLPFEVSPNFLIHKNLTIGVFYLYSYGFGDAIRNTHFLSLRGSWSNIRVFNTLMLRLQPQLFYLKLDEKDGYYTALNLSVSKLNFPFSISTMMNKPFQTGIAGKAFDWNISLNYTFGRRLVQE